MNMKMNNVLIRKLNLSVLCFSVGFGLIWQVYVIIQLYLEYKVISQITVATPEFLPIPAVSFCAEFSGVVNHELLSHVLENKNITYDAEKYRSRQNLIRVLTLQELFDVTPGTDEVMLQCLYRIKGSYLVYVHQCKRAFRITKYFYLQYICYQFKQRLTKIKDPTSPVSKDKRYMHNNESNHERNGRKSIIIDDDPFQYNLVAHSLQYQGLFLDIMLKKDIFDNVTVFSVQFSTVNEIPQGTNSFPAIVLGRTKTVNSDSDFINRRFFVSYQEVRNHYLPPPYETKCRDYSKTSIYSSSIDCKENCILLKVIKELNHIPQSSIFVDGYIGEGAAEANLPLIHETDMQNETFSSIFFSIIRSCFLKCSRLDCIETLIVTQKQRAEPSTTKYSLKLLVPYGPSILNVTRPKLTIVQFMHLLLNSWSFWTGFCIWRFGKKLKKRVFNRFLQKSYLHEKRWLTMRSARNKRSRFMNRFRLQYNA